MNRALTLKRWQDCQPLTDKVSMFENEANRAIGYKQNFYDPVAAAMNVPWYMIACLDMREESYNHSGYLGNGVPLYKYGFKTWFQGAVAALKKDNVIPSKGGGYHWDIVTVLQAMEAWNGLGYYYRGIASPYLFAGTNIQVPGKYVGEGIFDPHVIDIQPGCAGLLLAFKKYHNVDLNEA